jgi:hypothetical protein
MRSKLRASRVVAAAAVVAALAHQHGATIAVETPADGGTTMRLRFPS